MFDLLNGQIIGKKEALTTVLVEDNQRRRVVDRVARCATPFGLLKVDAKLGGHRPVATLRYQSPRRNSHRRPKCIAAAGPDRLAQDRQRP